MDIREKVEKLQNHLKANNYKFVIDECNKLIQKFPYNSFLYNLCGLALQGNGNTRHSIEYFNKSIDLDPNNFSAKNNLGNSYKAIGRYDLAESNYSSALKIKPDYVQALNNYANFKSLVNDYKTSIDLLEKALKISKNQIVLMYNLAENYKSIGEFNKAIEMHEKIIFDNNLHTNSHLSLSSMYNYNKDNKHLNQMLDLIKNEKLNKQNKIHLSFAIGKAYEDIGEHEISFNYYKEANKISNSILNYNFDNEKKLFDKIIATFNNIDFEKKYHESDEKKVIFICGMPRSGTTLVEQIISSHKDVRGCGELVYLQSSIKENLYSENSFDKNKLANLLNTNSNPIIKKYFEMLKFHGISEKIITDKAPQNFLWIGIIKIFIPNSKIIFCNRNPRDNCLSLYKNFFPAREMSWSYSEENIGNYFNQHKRIIEFWKNKIPNSIYEINYENLVNDQIAETKKLINFCELNWDENCLNFHKNNKTPISTVSVSQARRPIYKNSIDLNKNYENYLSKLFSIIN